MVLSAARIDTADRYRFSQASWNSLTANSPESARVYRATIAPEDQPAAERTEASETPLRNASTAQPRRHAWTEGAPRRLSSNRMAFEDIPSKEPDGRPAI